MLSPENIINELTSWIDNNLDKPLKIRDVASRSGYSHWHIQRIFSQVMNTSVGNYIREKKLEKAAHDLIQGRESISWISFKYGFDSQQSFTRVFRNKYMVPPARYRRDNSPARSTHSVR
ncbi:transcriptional regulator [Mangrovibacter sp. MFB070]|uniref:helix-turn-helix domain-containing protein n=1 Tax=Mangrovibacter sp. MFB070 TaxID=1224318 RepID=UPI0004D6AF1E|nr:helix-turn-helix domain-containing protein [Mangrovibacter sp. MFB070]KEA49986.1 transcriptional regulator [Mangrovibacter sp. MFB070]